MIERKKKECVWVWSSFRNNFVCKCAPHLFFFHLCGVETVHLSRCSLICLMLIIPLIRLNGNDPFTLYFLCFLKSMRLIYCLTSSQRFSSRCFFCRVLCLTCTRAVILCSFCSASCFSFSKPFHLVPVKHERCFSSSPPLTSSKRCVCLQFWSSTVTSCRVWAGNRTVHCWLPPAR